MTKKEMIKALAEKLGESQKRTVEILGGIEDFIEDVVFAEDEVTLCGVKIATKETKARKGEMENKYGAFKYDVPAKVLPTIKFVKSAKDKLTKEK